MKKLLIIIASVLALSSASAQVKISDYTRAISLNDSSLSDFSIYNYPGSYSTRAVTWYWMKRNMLEYGAFRLFRGVHALGYPFAGSDYSVGGSYWLSGVSILSGDTAAGISYYKSPRNNAVLVKRNEVLMNYDLNSGNETNINLNDTSIKFKTNNTPAGYFNNSGNLLLNNNLTVLDTIKVGEDSLGNQIFSQVGGHLQFAHKTGTANSANLYLGDGYFAASTFTNDISIYEATGIEITGNTLLYNELSVEGNTTLGNAANDTVNANGITNFQKVFNVRSYGAKGDGVTNDVTAIQSAVTALNAYGAGILYFPKGTYLVDTTIKVGSNTTVLGEGWSSIVRLADSTGRPNYGETHIFANNSTVSGNENITFKDIAINCNVAKQYWDADDLGGSGIHLNHARNSQVINVRIDSVWRSGVHYENDSGLLVDHCRISYTGSGGVLCGQISTWVRDVEGVTVRFCYIDKAESTVGRAGAGKSLIGLADNINGATVIDNYLDNADSYGVHILTHSGAGQYIYNVIVANNHITNIASGGVFISSTTTEMANIMIQNNHFEKCLRAVYASGGTAPINGLNITGNVIRESNGTGTAIFIANDNILNINISDNIIRNVTTRPFYGIRVAGNDNGIIISNNVVYNCDKSGIYFETTAANCQVLGNFLSTNDEYGIQEAATTLGNIYHANRFLSNGSGDISRVGTSRTEFNDGAPYTAALADNGSFNLASGRSGYGTLIAGDGAEWARFTFTTAGVVTLIDNSTNVTTTLGTNDKINIGDGGAFVTVQNTFAATTTVTVMVIYN